MAYFCAPNLTFPNLSIMDEQHVEIENSNDVAGNWVSTSRFIFYLLIASMIAWSIAASYGLYAKRYKGKPDVPVPENTLYNPKYK